MKANKEIVCIKEMIYALAEPEYQSFTSKLLPGVGNILGVRLPNLRKLANKIAKEDWRKYLDHAEDTYFEEIMLQGMVIGYAKPNTVDELFPYVRIYVNKIDNWSSCDSFCSGLKITNKYKDTVWKFLQEFFQSEKEYDIRFAVVMGLYYYINDEYKNRFLLLLDCIHHEGYYVKMAVAWAISMVYVKYPKYVMNYLKECKLDDFTYNKAIQKIRESLQVSKEEKELLKSMKRKV